MGDRCFAAEQQHGGEARVVNQSLDQAHNETHAAAARLRVWRAVGFLGVRLAA
jgi:hypothetical protein